MTDIDFDELDKAINSLVSGDSKKGTATATIPATPVAPVEPAVPVLTPAPATPAASPTPSLTVPTPPSRPQGRFMDVVHPSSDMRPGLNIPDRSPREGITITPPSAPEPVIPKPEPEPAEDPPAPQDTPVEPAVPVPTPTPVATESPFLKDAKVEKRPLGGLSEAVERTPDTDSPLPDELQPDVLSLESDNPQNQTMGDTISTELSNPIVQSHTQDLPADNQENPEPMYNAGTYQPVLSHPAKKKAGWLWVLWIVIILLAGVGAGAAMYFFVLPLL